MPIHTETLTASFDENVAMLDRLLRVNESFDLIRRPMRVGNTRLMLYYADGFVQTASMQKLMMHLLTVQDFGDGSPGAAQRFAEENTPTVEVDVTGSADALILAGAADAVVYLIRQDLTPLHSIQSCLSDFTQIDEPVLGCVLTGVDSGALGYGQLPRDPKQQPERRP